MRTATLAPITAIDRKSTRLNSSHGYISYAVFCLKKKAQIATSGARTPIVGFNKLYPGPTLVTTKNGTTNRTLKVNVANLFFFYTLGAPLRLILFPNHGLKV